MKLTKVRKIKIKMKTKGEDANERSIYCNRYYFCRLVFLN